jgi:hypothetical protein
VRIELVILKKKSRLTMALSFDFYYEFCSVWKTVESLLCTLSVTGVPGLVKGKGHPITGHEGPTGGVEVYPYSF